MSIDYHKFEPEFYSAITKLREELKRSNDLREAELKFKKLKYDDKTGPPLV